MPASFSMQLSIGAASLPFGAQPRVDFVEGSADDLRVAPAVELFRSPVEALDPEDRRVGRLEATPIEMPLNTSVAPTWNDSDITDRKTGLTNLVDVVNP